MRVSSENTAVFFACWLTGVVEAPNKFLFEIASEPANVSMVD